MANLPPPGDTGMMGADAGAVTTPPSDPSEMQPGLTCPSCGAQFNLEPMQQEQAEEGAGADDMGGDMGGGASGQPDQYDQMASSMESGRPKPFRDKSKVAAAFRQVGNKGSK